MAITREELSSTREIHELLRVASNAPIFRCHKWRVNGKMRTWKKSPERFELPVKFGLYTYGTFTNAHVSPSAYDSVLFTPASCPLCNKL